MFCFDSMATNVQVGSACNQIYMGDHMTRTWTKEPRHLPPGSPGSAAGSPTPDGSGLAENQTKETICPSNSQMSVGTADLAANVPMKIIQPIKKSELIVRKPSSKRKLKSGKEILQQHEITAEDFQQWQESFDSLLESPAGRYVFKIFLESEIADENLKFWLACEDLKTTTKQKRIEKRIQDIYDTYINVHSPHEVNIDYKMREDIVDQLKYKMETSIFTEAQNQIYTLMHRDSYPRFLSSSFTADLEKELLKRRASRAPSEKYKSETSAKSSDIMSCCYCRRQTDMDTNSLADEPCVKRNTSTGNQANKAQQPAQTVENHDTSSLKPKTEDHIEKLSHPCSSVSKDLSKDKVCFKGADNCIEIAAQRPRHAGLNSLMQCEQEDTSSTAIPKALVKENIAATAPDSQTALG
ncbi:unnamed protein product [Clavelina lepadiformis]|uniref:RGS domain-containing protein n=1 Tax=Clavelina lepadiformis TaxID=159417 RepID=A0ABP0H1U5_CLALP